MLQSQQSQEGGGFFTSGDPLQSAHQVDDLQFATSVDHAISQTHVPLPAPKQYIPDAPMSGAMGGGEVINGEEQSSKKSSIFGESSHPTVCLFHCLFKILSLVLFLFGGYFSQSSSASRKDRKQEEGANFILVTVLCILLLACDFWVVKNVTGRLLVGLRWWNRVEPDGQATTWIFESANEDSKNRFDSMIFWTVLYVTPFFWLLLTGLEFLRLKLGWIIVTSMGVALSAANLYGYYKCSKDQKVKFQQMISQGATWGATTALKNGFLGRILFGASAPQPQQQSSNDPNIYV